MATEVAFVVDPVGWEHAFRSWTGPVGFWLRAKTNETRIAAALEAPKPGAPARNRTGISYATGRLASSHTVELASGGIGRDLEGRVRAHTKYAVFLHEGTRPHIIHAKHPPKHLYFFWRKKGHFVAPLFVKHPGTVPNPWLARALVRTIR